MFTIFFFFQNCLKYIFISFSVNYPKNVNFDEPEKEGLPGTRNFYIETEKGVKVGVWYAIALISVLCSATHVIFF